VIIQTIKQSVKAALQAAKPVELWPQPELKYQGDEPRFLFLMTPPYSGSTALSQVLNSGNGSCLLQFRGEGQWLCPGLVRAAWNDTPVEWDSVRTVWLNQVAKTASLVGRIDLVIEKSPPNLVRMNHFCKVFPNHQLVAFNRNPFAQISSRFFRHHRADIGGEKRTEILSTFATDWVNRSGYVKDLIQQHDCVWFTYEEFCRDPDEYVARICEVEPALTQIDTSRAIKVKDYQAQGIVNQNQKQIAKLTNEDLAAISAVLSKNEETLQFFRYTSDWRAPMEAGGAAALQRSA